MIGRLWWHRSHAWGVEIDGEQHLAESVELVGATVRTAVAKDGSFDLPGGPLAIVEFEAQAIILEQKTTEGLMVREFRAVTPANDNNRPNEATEQS